MSDNTSDGMLEPTWDDRRHDSLCWVLYSDTYHAAANLLHDVHRQCTAALVREIREIKKPAIRPELWFDSVAGMCLGLSIELAIKAVLIERDPDIIDVFNKFVSHDLVKLAKKAEIPIDDKETKLLDNLHEMVKWGGKYPIPVTKNAWIIDEDGMFPGTMNPEHMRDIEALYKKIRSMARPPAKAI